MTPLPRATEKYFALPPSDTVYALALAAGVSETVQKPAGAFAAMFCITGGNDFYVKYDAASVSIPSSDITNGTAPEMNPYFRLVEEVGRISVICAADAVVTIAFYAKPEA